MDQVLTAIALLCQINGTNQYGIDIDRMIHQEKCQKQLARCVVIKSHELNLKANSALLECVAGM